VRLICYRRFFTFARSVEARSARTSVIVSASVRAFDNLLHATAAHHAKKFHGTRCQACELDFGERYGKIGQGFIEAHHLRPIATLEEGVPVKYFAVLCSNCHRMIHRFADPSDLVAFREFTSRSAGDS
jgi:hypothetical protein